MELDGIGADIWKSVETLEYVNKIAAYFGVS
jgi:hypothetical protein